MVKQKDKHDKLNRPFDADIMAKARHLADEYDLVLRFEDGEWWGHALEYPEAIGDGDTSDKCVKATRQALAIGIASMLEIGQTPPQAARGGKRTIQVNVRLTPEEKALLELKSRAKGFSGLSDYIRASALKETA